MSERSRAPNLQTKARDYSSSKRKQYAEPSLSQLTEQAEEALQYNDSGVQSKDLSRVNGAITSARAFIGSSQNQDSLAGPSRRTFKATYSSYDPVARRQRESRELGEDVYAALGRKLEDGAEWLRDILTEPYKDTKQFISDTQRKAAESAVALPAYSAPTYDPIPAHLGTTKQLWKNSRMAPPPPANRQIPSAELPASDTEENERDQRPRRQRSHAEDRHYRHSTYHDDQRRRTRESRDPVHRRRSEELRDTRSPSNRKSTTRRYEESDEEDVDLRGRPSRRRRMEADEYYPDQSRHRSRSQVRPSKYHTPRESRATENYCERPERTRHIRHDHSDAPPLVPMHYDQSNPNDYSRHAPYSSPIARSATVPPGYVESEPFVVPSRLPLETFGSYRSGHVSSLNGPQDYLDHEQRPPTFLPNPNIYYNNSVNNHMAARSSLAQKMQAAVEQQRLSPIRGHMKASQAFVPVHSLPDEDRMDVTHDRRHPSTLNYILNHTSPDLHDHAMPPSGAGAYSNYFTPPRLYTNTAGPNLHPESANHSSAGVFQPENRWDHEQSFSGQSAAPPSQQEQFSTILAPVKSSQSHPIATHSYSSPLQDLPDSTGPAGDAIFDAIEAAGNAQQYAATDGAVASTVLPPFEQQPPSEPIAENYNTNLKKTMKVPDRSQPGWHPPLPAAEKRRLEREASLISQPSPSNYQSSSAKSNVTSAKPVKISMAYVNFSLKEPIVAGPGLESGSGFENDTPSQPPQHWQPPKMASMSGMHTPGIEYTQNSNEQHGKGDVNNDKIQTINNKTRSSAISRLARNAHKAPLQHSGSITAMKITPIRRNTRSSANAIKASNFTKAVKASSSSQINASDSIDDDEGPLTPSNTDVPAFFRNNQTKIDF